MTISTARRKSPFKSHKFVTTSVVSESCVQYGINRNSLDTPESANEFWNAVIAEDPSHEPNKEQLIVVLLDGRLRPFAWNLVSMGTVTETIAHPREILRPCIAGNAYAFILLHNHPSGDPSPSKGDEIVTHKLIEAAKLMQIEFFDHIIVGKTAPGKSPYYSFRETGIIQ